MMRLLRGHGKPGMLGLGLAAVLAALIAVGAGRAIANTGASGLQPFRTAPADGTDSTDWVEMPSLDDPMGDASGEGDILRFAWNDGASDGRFSWMIETSSLMNDAEVRIHLDMDDDGAFDGESDRTVEVSYSGDGHAPSARVSDASGEVRGDAGARLLDGPSPGSDTRRLEVSVPAETVGFRFGSVYRVYVESSGGDRAPDSGDVQSGSFRSRIGITWASRKPIGIFWGMTASGSVLKGARFQMGSCRSAWIKILYPSLGLSSSSRLSGHGRRR